MLDQFFKLPEDKRINATRFLTPADMIALMQTSRVLRSALMYGSIWFDYVVSDHRYTHNLYNRYIADMQYGNLTRLTKFLIHKYGWKYQDAKRISIPDDRLVAKIISGEMTIVDAQGAMCMSLKWRNKILAGELSLDEALKQYEIEVQQLLKFHIVSMQDTNFSKIHQVNPHSVLAYLLKTAQGIKMIYEGYIPIKEYNECSDIVVLGLSFSTTPNILTALREGLVTGYQLFEMRENPARIICPYFVDVMFSDSALDAMRMGYITAEESVACHSEFKKLRKLKDKITCFSQNYLEKSVVRELLPPRWLTINTNLEKAKFLLSQENGWELLESKQVTCKHLERIIDMKFLEYMMDDDLLREAIISKKIKMDDLVKLKNIQHLENIL